MARRICIIQGHPDAESRHFGHAIAEAYAQSADRAGHEVRTIAVGELDFPVLCSREQWLDGAVPELIAEAQRTIAWAQHLVIVYPLWLGTMPALLKAFMEQVMRPGFALPPGAARPGAGLLKGRSARVIVTMGMPAFVYRWFYGAHSLKVLKRNILHFVGISPVRSTLIGMVEGANPARREKWLSRIADLGRLAR